MASLLTMCGAADSGLLARIVGIFHQLGLPPPSLEVRVSGDRMVALLAVGSLELDQRQAVSRKIGAFVGVDYCILS